GDIIGKIGLITAVDEHDAMTVEFETLHALEERFGRRGERGGRVDSLEQGRKVRVFPALVLPRRKTVRLESCQRCLAERLKQASAGTRQLRGDRVELADR